LIDEWRLLFTVLGSQKTMPVRHWKVWALWLGCWRQWGKFGLNM